MPPDDVRSKAQAARDAALQLAQAPDAQRRDALEAYARLLDERADEVEAANRKDVEAAEDAVERGEMAPVLLDRLHLHGPKLEQAIAGVRAVAHQDDPVGRTLRATELDDGLELRQVTVPIGVLATAFESRPDAAVQIASLAIRTGNAVLLKGGREAAASNALVAELAREALVETDLPPDGVVNLRERAELQALLDMDDLVDLVVPRGSSGFVRYVMDHTRIPVLGHAEGVCHVLVDAHADPGMAVDLVVDGKTDYPAACNATETVLVHADVADAVVPRLVDALVDAGVEVRADARARDLHPDGTVPADEDDWGREFGDLALALRVVPDLQAGIDHVNRHGSHHTDAIVTGDDDAARRFVQGVDTAGAYVNASTRFSDGYRYGLGAEVGISTSKVHARGPVGLDGLTTTKWILEGRGHRVGDYRGPDGRAFTHRDLREDPRDE